MTRVIVALLLSGVSALSQACGLFQDRFDGETPSDWTPCIDVSIEAPTSVLVTVQSGVNEDRQNFTEAVIAPQPGFVLRRSQVTTDCAAGLAWENNVVRIEPVTSPCQLQVDDPTFAPNPDTGITRCSSVDVLGDCPIAGYPGQDAERGLYLLDDRIKVGSGVGSRDFTKLDETGQPLPAEASVWACVRDNQTGLVWEHKVNDNTSIHHLIHTFSWFSEDNDVNGGGPGTQDGGSCNGLISCDTAGLISALNDKTLCGREDWSLPSPTELSSLLHWSEANINSIMLIGDSSFFPHRSPGPHWSFVPSSEGFAYAVNTAALDSSNGGNIASDSKNTGRAALLVSRQDAPQLAAASNQPPANTCDLGFTATAPSHYFTILEDESLVRDERTGLVWQRCKVSQSWNSATQTCDDPPEGVSVFTWKEAFETANAMSSGWRLPTRHEAVTIIEFCNSAPPVNLQVFPNTKPFSSGSLGRKWTSSPNIQPVSFGETPSPNRAWIVELAGRGRILGRGDLNQMTNNYYLRLVRDDVPLTEP